MILSAIAFLIADAYQTRATIARYDLGRYVARLSDGRAQSWRERLNVARFAATSRVTFESADIAHNRMLRERAIRCDVFADRHGFSGTRAVFNVA